MLKVLFASSEISPWVKTGGLGDVAAALPPALAAAGCELRLLLPAYPALRQAFGERLAPIARVAPAGAALPGATLLSAPMGDGVELMLLDAPHLYDRPGNPYVDANGRDHPDNLLRFGLLSRVAALLSSADSPIGWRPHVLHCNDWQTGLAPAFLHYFHGGERAASVLTIHNIAFQGLFGREALDALGLPGDAFRFDGVEFHGHVSFLKAGLQFCDRIATVSPTYAREILSPEFGWGLEGLLRHRADRVHGILNGIDTDAWNPASDPALARTYDAGTLERKAENRRDLQRRIGLAADEGAPLLGVVSRLTGQKGLDLLLALGDRLCEGGAQIALLGSGEAALQDGWQAVAHRHPGRCAVVLGFDEALAHRIEAGADLFVMPSRFEPCGLNQMYSMRYGTPPVVRRTGGLADTVVDADEAARTGGQGNGFVFDEPSAQSLEEALRRAFAARRDASRWRAIQRAGMSADFGWAGAAREYLAVMQLAAAGRRDAA
ncbi:MAG TPA: glycogen synthase GlgA [Quisquiliibacterium sp.]|nr:glycogen synthase GlgA [Quisquiliibacterium sp.]